MDNCKSKAEYFRLMGEIQKPNESYATWFKRCSLKYREDIRKKQQVYTNKNNMKWYYYKKEFIVLCKIDVF